ncbi:MAG TPA: S1C family serine protease, partial [Burkholderiales bacterium]|nr:S1C family serine protease [Burkholderiales bacterium]
MKHVQNPFLFRGLSRRQCGAASTWLLLIIIAGLLWWFWPAQQRTSSAPAVTQSEPRAVAARGSLAEDEQNNIAVFKAASPAAVNITTLESGYSLFSLNVTQVPRGTGTGFIWDELGHVVTNFHVLQGANGARVTLADQSTWKAALVGVFPD